MRKKKKLQRTTQELSTLVHNTEELLKNYTIEDEDPLLSSISTSLKKLQSQLNSSEHLRAQRILNKKTQFHKPIEFGPDPDPELDESFRQKLKRKRLPSTPRKDVRVTIREPPAGGVERVFKSPKYARAPTPTLQEILKDESLDPKTLLTQAGENWEPLMAKVTHLPKTPVPPSQHHVFFPRVRVPEIEVDLKKEKQRPVVYPFQPSRRASTASINDLADNTSLSNVGPAREVSFNEPSPKKESLNEADSRIPLWARRRANQSPVPAEFFRGHPRPVRAFKTTHSHKRHPDQCYLRATESVGKLDEIREKIWQKSYKGCLESIFPDPDRGYESTDLKAILKDKIGLNLTPLECDHIYATVLPTKDGDAGVLRKKDFLEFMTEKKPTRNRSRRPSSAMQRTRPNDHEHDGARERRTSIHLRSNLSKECMEFADSTDFYKKSINLEPDTPRNSTPPTPCITYPRVGLPLSEPYNLHSPILHTPKKVRDLNLVFGQSPTRMESGKKRRKSIIIDTTLAGSPSTKLSRPSSGKRRFNLAKNRESHRHFDFREPPSPPRHVKRPLSAHTYYSSGKTGMKATVQAAGKRTPRATSGGSTRSFKDFVSGSGMLAFPGRGVKRCQRFPSSRQAVRSWRLKDKQKERFGKRIFFSRFTQDSLEDRSIPPNKRVEPPSAGYKHPRLNEPRHLKQVHCMAAHSRLRGIIAQDRSEIKDAFKRISKEEANAGE